MYNSNQASVQSHTASVSTANGSLSQQLPCNSMNTNFLRLQQQSHLDVTIATATWQSIIIMQDQYQHQLSSSTASRLDHNWLPQLSTDSVSKGDKQSSINRLPSTPLECFDFTQKSTSCYRIPVLSKQSISNPMPCIALKPLIHYCWSSKLNFFYHKTQRVWRPLATRAKAGMRPVELTSYLYLFGVTGAPGRGTGAPGPGAPARGPGAPGPLGNGSPTKVLGPRSLASHQDSRSPSKQMASSSTRTTPIRTDTSTQIKLAVHFPRNPHQ